MSICSSVYITKEEAQKMVKALLISQQEELIDLAVKQMSDSDLTYRLSDERYDFNIKKKTKND